MDGFVYGDEELNFETEFSKSEEPIKTDNEPEKENRETSSQSEDGHSAAVLPCEIPINSLTLPETAPEKTCKTTPFRKTGLFLTLVFCAVSLLFYGFAASQTGKSLLTKDTRSIIKKEMFSVFFLPDSFFESDTAAEKDDAETENSLPAEDVDETYPIKRTNLSVASKNAFSLNNQTNYSVRPSELIRNGTELLHTEQIYEKYGSDAPVVLIVHTHGTEAYSDNDTQYDLNEPFRSNDVSKNVVSVGKVMAEVFKEAGINVIHDTEMYDLQSYKDSYSRSRAAVARHLEKNPSITYIFDVHRDAIIKNDMTALCPVGYYEGDEIAQIMLVAGTDQDGADHGKWQKNLTLALQIQSELTNTSEELARSINLRTSAFNQGLSEGSLLLEIGACANTLVQAKRCAVLSALSISEVINGKETKLSPSLLLEKYANE